MVIYEGEQTRDYITAPDDFVKRLVDKSPGAYGDTGDGIIRGMKIVRFKADGRTGYGVLRSGGIYQIDRSPFSSFKGGNSHALVTGRKYRLADVRLLAPCRPSKIVCVGLNYRSHANEMKQPFPPVPLLFIKPPSAVINPGDSIIRPRSARRVDYEAELGVVIGQEAKDIARERVLEYILGYTCFNDVTERAVQKDDIQWTRAKGYDTFAPFGPWIETELDPADIKVEAYLNGELKQSGSTGDLIFPVADLITFISGVMTLVPGDVIATGTPSGIGPMAAGDTIEIRVEGVGSLKNTVIDAS
jgi:2-keto-4-pentenoate hydratase/2-oxohepta-3-ene-1,7-dioic acid hydratase in catechol pathway